MPKRMSNKINYSRFLELNEKIKFQKATQSEKDEYMLMLYQNGDISEKQYEDYKVRDEDSNELLKAGLTIGGIILVSYLLSKLIDEKN